MKNFIKQEFSAESVFLKDIVKKVFISAQVNLINVDENLEYREISMADIKKSGAYSKKKGANSTSLANQKLEAGDVLISARIKLDKVRVIRENEISSKIPLVAMKGIIIIRAGSEDLGLFIEQFLELPFIVSFINANLFNGSIQKHITKSAISNLLFPDVKNSNFNLFVKYKDYYSQLEIKTFRLYEKLENLRNIQLGSAYRNALENDKSYNLNDWKKIEIILNSLEREVNKLSDEL